MNPDANEDALTISIPHVMYFAPQISNQDVGGSIPAPEEFEHLARHGHWPGTRYPFVILHGPHGYTVQFLGAVERAGIMKEYEEMLARLCEIKDLWCLPKEQGQ